MFKVSWALGIQLIIVNFGSKHSVICLIVETICVDDVGQVGDNSATSSPLHVWMADGDDIMGESWGSSELLL